MEKSVIIEGRVVRGHSLGRKLGFPTANLALPRDMKEFRGGVYFGRATLACGEKYYALVNIGDRPTVNQVCDPLLEAHLIGFSGSLYGEVLRVELLDYMRQERRFENPGQLKMAIENDLKNTEQLIEKYESGL